jgi:hypothetical protein
MKKLKEKYNGIWWFVSAILFFVIYTGLSIKAKSMTDGTEFFANLLNVTVLTSILIANGIRSSRGKKTYFWRMIAIYFVTIFAIFVFSTMYIDI